MKKYRFADIHDTAVVDPAAKIAKGVKIGPYSVIGANVKIGQGTTIGSNAHIEGWTTIGNDNLIGNGVSIGLPPQNLDYEGEKTYLFIGDNNIIREYVTIHLGTIEGGGETRIGNNNQLMVYSHVAHDCNLGNNITIANAANLAGHVNVENDAYISRLVGIHQFVKIGQLSLVGSHSKVTKDLPPYVEVQGHPAMVKGINVVGLRKNGISNKLKKEINKAFSILYESDLNISQAIKKMDQELQTSKEIEHFIRFLKNSTRGICR